MPLEGFRRNTHDIETRRAGKTFGMIAVSSKRVLKGALVLIVIQARVIPISRDNVDAPKAKMIEFIIKL